MHLHFDQNSSPACRPSYIFILLFPDSNISHKRVHAWADRVDKNASQSARDMIADPNCHDRFLKRLQLMKSSRWDDWHSFHGTNYEPSIPVMPSYLPIPKRHSLSRSWAGGQACLKMKESRLCAFLVGYNDTQSRNPSGAILDTSSSPVQLIDTTG